jgi:phosphoribosyl 1,2-cyclic phosphodiesterase
MTMRFHILASGSTGNASILEAGDFGVLIDFGIPVRTLEQRMRRCGLSWKHIHAVLLTHTHSDHWQSSTLVQLAKRGLPFYCHAEHAEILERGSRGFKKLRAAGLTRFYEVGQPWSLHRECRCLPIRLQHDSSMTCGFRFEGHRTIFGIAWALGYATDLGVWTPEIARQFAGVDLLALEFNHDVAMQLQSGRPPMLIRRVLSDQGHLSNEQAAGLLAEVLQQSEPDGLKSLVQLHLSEECNRPELARTAAQHVLDRFGIAAAIHTAGPAQFGPSIRLGARPTAEAPRRRPRRRSLTHFQPLLSCMAADASEALCI